jgi:chitin synthase
MILTIFISGFFYLCKKENEQIFNKNIAYLIPCYNESYEELDETVDSFINQNNIENNKKILIICCDGVSTGKGNDIPTSQILQDQIFRDYIYETIYYPNAYKTWTNEYNGVTLSYGMIRNLPFILINKKNNIGKRDSVTLIRRNLYLYNNMNDIELFNKPYNDLTDFNKKLFTILENYSITNIDAIIGTDGDTVLDENCANHLINDLYNYKDNSLMGVAGFIKVSPYMNPYSLWTIYQFTSYTYGQLLVRLHQSRITRKVNCLPGCVQIFKVCKETCGYEILNIFNNLPDENEILYKHMRAHMGEDRMHICTMMHMYPYVKTKQSIQAFAYTRVPNTWKVFLSQRRRWNLGSNSNKLILLTNRGINLYEKFATFLSIIAWYFTIFYSFAFIHIIYILIKANYNEISTLMYLTIISLGIIIVMPKIYMLTFPFWVSMNKKEVIQLYVGCALYNFINIPVVLIVHIYTLLNMDNLSWGKTRECIECENSEFIEVLTPR